MSSEAVLCIMLGLTVSVTSGQSLTTCTDLPALGNGIINYDNMDTPRPQGTVATHSCVTGYEPSSGPTRACVDSGNGNGGVWNGLEITCDRVSCGNPPTVLNGAVMSMTGTLFEGTVTYNCSDGYQLMGSATIMCKADRSWETAPTCQAICTDLSEPDNGMIQYNSGTMDNRLEGTMVTHSCDTGYELSGGSTRTCVDNGSTGGRWSGTTITCIAGCPNITLPNGMVTYSENSFPILAGVMITHSCENGYSLSGDVVQTCVTATTGGGEWNGIPVTCRAICDDLDNTITNIVLTYDSDSSPRLEGTTAMYTCNLGLTLMGGTATRTCQNDRTWSGTEPFCQRVFLQLGGSSDPVTSDSSELVISQVGQGNEGLICRTDHPQCCNSTQASWIGPDDVISSSPGEDGFYVDYDDGFVSLNSDGTSTATGRYCCIVPVDGGGMDLTFCIKLIQDVDANNSNVGFAVAIALILAAAVTVIVILVILLIVTRKHLKEARVQLERQQVYDTPDQVYYEDVSKMDVGEASKEGHTHPSVMELRQCPAYAPTEVSGRTEECIYDN